MRMSGQSIRVPELFRSVKNEIRRNLLRAIERH